MAADDVPRTLIAVDVGNSRIKLGRFDRRGRPAPRDTTTDISVPEPSEVLELPLADISGRFDAAELAAWCDEQVPSAADWLVGSVHRGALERFASAVAELARRSGRTRPIRRLTHRDVPMAVDVEAPEKVGIDRLLAALAADYLRRRDRAAIVVDLGTAITIDLVTETGAFAGGAILPGLAMSAGALHEQTDALPHVKVNDWTHPPEPLGKATVAAIEAGLFWGTVGAIRQLVEKHSAGLVQPPQVFVSGGGSRLFAEVLSEAGSVDVCHAPHLVLAGIALVHWREPVAGESTTGRADGHG